jgi:hypothetical protein
MDYWASSAKFIYIILRNILILTLILTLRLILPFYCELTLCYVHMCSSCVMCKTAIFTSFVWMWNLDPRIGG